MSQDIGPRETQESDAGVEKAILATVVLDKRAPVNVTVVLDS
jgi:hypothetical protein